MDSFLSGPFFVATHRAYEKHFYKSIRKSKAQNRIGSAIISCCHTFFPASAPGPHRLIHQVYFSYCPSSSGISFFFYDEGYCPKGQKLCRHFPGDSHRIWILQKWRHSFFIGISRVHDTPDISRELKEGADILPVVFQITDRIGIFLSPLLFYNFQLRKCGCLIRVIVYHLEIRGELLQLILIHIFKRVTQHMDDTPLYFSLRINSLNCIFKAREPIYTEEQYLFYTTVS